MTGDSIYNLLRLGEVETDKDDRPLDPPPKISSVEVYFMLSLKSDFYFILFFISVEKPLTVDGN